MQQNALEHGRNGCNDATQVRQLEGQFNMMLDVSKKFCFSVTVDPDGPCNKLYALWLHSTLLGHPTVTTRAAAFTVSVSLGCATRLSASDASALSRSSHSLAERHWRSASGPPADLFFCLLRPGGASRSRCSAPRLDTHWLWVCLRRYVLVTNVESDMLDWCAALEVAAQCGSSEQITKLIVCCLKPPSTLEPAGGIFRRKNVSRSRRCLVPEL